MNTSLICGGVYECPKCRHKTNVNSPNDFPVVFGLIDVIRALKTKKLVSSIRAHSMESGATNADACNIHYKPISHWCNKCELWICELCTESHSVLMGCSTVTSTEAIGTLKHKHIAGINTLMTVCEEDVKYLTLKKQELDRKLQTWTEQDSLKCLKCPPKLSSMSSTIVLHNCHPIFWMTKMEYMEDISNTVVPALLRNGPQKSRTCNGFREVTSCNSWKSPVTHFFYFSIIFLGHYAKNAVYGKCVPNQNDLTVSTLFQLGASVNCTGKGNKGDFNGSISKKWLRLKGQEQIWKKSVEKGCASCKLWICASCEEYHTPDISFEIKDY